MAAGDLYLTLYVRDESRPTESLAAERAYALLTPLTRHDRAAGWPMLKLAAAMTLGESPVWDLVEAPGMEAYLAPDVAPAPWLPWLARLVGGRLTPSMAEEQQRLEVANPSGWRRGGIDDLGAAITSQLTGGRRVIIRERDGSASHITIRTRLSETPDPDAVKALILSRLITGLTLDYQALDERDWAEVASTWETWQDVTDANTSWHDVDVAPAT